MDSESISIYDEMIRACYVIKDNPDSRAAQIRVNILLDHLQKLRDHTSCENYVSGKHICVDFDGTISDDSAGFISLDVIGDSKPNPGAIEFLRSALDKGYKVIIWSVRCNSVLAQMNICKWLFQYGLGSSHIDQLVMLPGKPPASLYIDDRSIRYEHNWGIIKDEL